MTPPPPNQNPEQSARDVIDARLENAGWTVVDRKKLDWNAGLGLAVREYPTDIGPADYVLFVDRTPLGVIEAKRDDEGYHLTTHETQTNDYAESQLRHIKHEALPFRYQATGVKIFFTDARDPKPCSREIFSFQRPETLQALAKETKTLRARMHDIPALERGRLHECQFAAIQNLEQSFRSGHPRALIQMATGSGKTYTAITSVYRLLKFAKAKRILFLVDTKNLGEQAEQEFMAFTPSDDNRKFTELYNVSRLRSRFIPSDNQVYISTIQRLYSILRNREMEEAAEETNPNEIRSQNQNPQEVVYNEDVPPEFFDLIIIDECHRSIYNLWKQVLDYFDAFLVGLTATPDKRTFGFFNENVVSEYSHTRAVADGVNVGYLPYIIKTAITQGGGLIEAKEYVDKRDRQTRRTRWEQLDDDLEYHGGDLDRDVVNPSQIRTVIRTFKDRLPDLFPNRTEVPKTLIFAKTDSHADDIIRIVREVFGEGNDFCKKITYGQREEDPKEILSAYRNEYYPRIAVTVDMIATGTDVRPLECLIFMRDVRSRTYFEQMLGRGTRTQGKDDLCRVTPSATTAKSHFLVVDAVGVLESCKTDARPLEKKPSVPIKDLLAQVLMGQQDEEIFSSLAGRLARLDKELAVEERREMKRLAKGNPTSVLVKALLDAHDPDVIDEIARKTFSLPEGKEPDETQRKNVKDDLARQASGLFNGELNQFIERARQAHDQIIDRTNIDHVTYEGWGQQRHENIQALVTDFKQFIETHRDEITALKIIFNEPHRRKEITYAMIQEVADALRANRPNLAPLRVFEAYAMLDKVKPGNPASELTAIVSLIRRISEIDKQLTNYDDRVAANFQAWVFRKQAGPVKFTKEQMEWLHMIKNHIASSFHLEKDDLDLTPFDAKGGLAKMYDLFGQGMESIISEMNEALVA